MGMSLAPSPTAMASAGVRPFTRLRCLSAASFGFLAENGFGHLARELAIFDDEVVGLIGVKAEAGCDL